MKKLITITFIYCLTASPLLAQGHGPGSGHHGMYPDSMETITLSGTALVDSTFFMTVYYLDVDNDDNADYHLSFGPFWYQPASGATRPADGDAAIITGARWGQELDMLTIVVYEINGMEWRQPLEGGMHGWDGDHFWGEARPDTTVEGTFLIDSSYFYIHYYLDTNDDQAPDFRLNFGPPWYLIENETLLPESGEQVTVTGGIHDQGLLGVPSLIVYEFNGMEWRDPLGPPPWSGSWVHRNAGDTSFVHAPTDSMDWMSIIPGAMMGHRMGGGMFPDSVYYQFEEMHRYFLPGPHDSTLFSGYFMNMYNPQGQTMMRQRGVMGRHLRFNGSNGFHLHYNDEFLNQLGLSDDEIMVRYWDDENSMWSEVTDYSIDTESNTITFSSDDLYSYYALYGSYLATGIDEAGSTELPLEFMLYQNYPNPFNPETTIKFDLAKSGEVHLAIFNVLGQQIKTLIDRNMSAGLHSIIWNGTDEANRALPTGIYFIQLTVNKQNRHVRKLTLIK